MSNFYENMEEKNVAWQAILRYSDVPNMNEEEIGLFINALGLAVQKVCWDYGVHN